MNDPSLENELFDEVAESFVQRLRSGEHPALAEYTEKYPQLAERIRKLFPALVVMEKVGSVDGGTAAAQGEQVAKIDASKIPTSLGDYRIVREIGRGGMGIVYEAIQESLHRHVALKVLPFHSWVKPKHLERFEREARAAARLHHTNIVPVFGVGQSEGIHYYAMQFIQGQSLDAVLQQVKGLRRQQLSNKTAETKAPHSLAMSVAGSLLGGQFPANQPPVEEQALLSLSPSPSLSRVAAASPQPGRGEREGEREREREGEGQGSGQSSSGRGSGAPPASQSDLTTQLDSQYYRSVAQIGLQVAEALEYAHSQGVLHRDVKPSNLLLDMAGRVWVTDFGLAKTDESYDLTNPGDMVGTLRYMGPERLQGRADPRSDVYGLGITLYELLTLRPAFEDSSRAGLIERINSQSPKPMRRVDAHIPRDLETIVQKAMAKQPAGRYPSAGLLADDLRHFLDHQPIRARRSSVIERVWRWCRRNPAVAGLAATLLLALLSGTAGITWQWRRAEANYQAARSQRARADANLRKARAALDEFFTRVSESKLINVPGAQPLRRELLDLALGYYQDFLQDARDDPELQAEVAAADFRVASANILLNQADQAVAAMREGLDLVEKLLEAHPADREWPKRLAGFLRSARTLHNDFWLLSRRRRDDTFGRATRLWERFAQDYPDVEGFRSDLALLALLQVEGPHEGKCRDDALSLCRRARELTEALIREHPRELVYHELLRRACHNAQDVLISLGRQAESEVWIRDTLAFCEQQEREHPGLPLLRIDQAELLNVLGRFLGHTDRPAEQEAAHQRAVAILEKLCKDWPKQVDFADELASSYHMLGFVRHRLNRKAEAESAFRQAAGILERLATALPADPNYPHDLARLCYDLGDHLALQNRLEEAEKLFRQAMELQEKLAEQYPDVEKYGRWAWPYWPCRRYLIFLRLAAGKEPEAEQILRQSQKDLEKLQAENAAKPGAWHALADYQRVRGHLLALAKRPAEAAAAMEFCIDLVRKRPEFFREAPFSGGNLEGSTALLLESLNRSRRYPEAEIIRRQIIDLYDRLARVDADNPAFLAYEIRHLLSFANWLRSRARPKDAEQLLPRALDCYRRLTTRFPDFHERAQLALLLDDRLRDTGRLADPSR